MIINQAKKPLDDVKVRTAICQSIDREAIVKAVLFGNGKVANSFIPGGALYYNADNPSCKYDSGRRQEACSPMPAPAT